MLASALSSHAAHLTLLQIMYLHIQSCQVNQRVCIFWRVGKGLLVEMNSCIMVSQRIDILCHLLTDVCSHFMFLHIATRLVNSHSFQHMTLVVTSVFQCCKRCLNVPAFSRTLDKSNRSFVQPVSAKRSLLSTLASNYCKSIFSALSCCPNFMYSSAMSSFNCPSSSTFTASL